MDLRGISGVAVGWTFRVTLIVSLVVQHLEDLGRQILLATNVYMTYRERIIYLGYSG